MTADDLKRAEEAYQRAQCANFVQPCKCGKHIFPPCREAQASDQKASS